MWNDWGGEAGGGGGGGGRGNGGGLLREIFSFAVAENCVCYMVIMNDWSGQ